MALSSVSITRLLFPEPLTPERTATLTKVTDVVVPDGSSLVTGGDIHPDGDGVLLRTYTHLWFYSLSGGDVGAALANMPCEMPVLNEAQGETVAWTAAGDGYITVSEGDQPPVNSVACPSD